MMEILVRLVGAAAAIYGAAYFIVGMVDAEKFSDYFSVLEAERRGSTGLRFYIRMGVTLLGCGFFMYSAAYSIFQVIPADWGSFTEDGEWEYTRHGLQIAFAAFATLGVLSGFEKRARQLAVLPFTRLEMESLDEEIRASGTPEMRGHIEDRFKAKLERLEEETSCSLVKRICRHEISIREPRTPNSRHS